MSTPSIGSLEILAEGDSPYFPVDPDGFRAWVRDNKDRSLRSKLMSEKDAVERLVGDGDYLTYDCNYLMRGPNSLLHEVIRQKKKDLWIAGKFTYVDVALLVGAGCVSKVDCGFFIAAAPVQKAVRDGRLEVFEYSNVVMTARLQAGAMGLPFASVRSFGGTDGFMNSGAKLIRDPYTNKPITVVPALNPDVSVIHVNQADIYGNARVFGTGIAHEECALASRKVIVSAEEIVDTEEIRRDPGRTSIPYYAVDAVVESPFGGFPGACPGDYGSDTAGVMEIFGAISTDNVDAYVEKWITPFDEHSEMLEKGVGIKRLLEMKRREVVKEGYSA
ncbi:MAG TPA: CoA-transferase [Dehalococcoidia bacterium]|nr:CoA-transferase [Dehalococcoidia bacterium]